MRRRHALLALGTALAAPALAQGAGDGWPNRPLRWLVGFPPGGSNDVTARLLGQGVAARVGQPVVVENRPSAGALLAGEAAARSAPDGHTWLSVGNGPLVYNPVLFASMPFNPDRDLRGLGFIGRFPLLVVTRADRPAKTFADLLAQPPAAPPSYGSAGIASPHHLAGEMLKRRTGWRAEHVPYRGIPAAMNDLLGGTLDFLVADLAAALQLLRGGRIRALLLLSETRSRHLPEVPAVAEIGHPGAVSFGWQGVSVPAATPDALVARMNGVLGAALGDPAAAARLDELGVETQRMSAAEFDAFVRREAATWRPLIRELGIRQEA